MTATGTDDPRFAAAIALIGRTGASSLQARWSDDEKPTVYLVVALYPNGKWETAAGHHPLEAALRLCEQLVDGGLCTHCRRPTAVSDDFEGAMPLEADVCWYRYDPELRTFRRGCEGDVARRT